jgi:hypothetical protein
MEIRPMPQTTLGTTEANTTLTTDEVWYCKAGRIDVDSATMNESTDGLTLTPGQSIAFGSGCTVYYRPSPGNEGGANVIVRVATST